MQFCGIGLGYMRVPPNGVTFSQKFADNVRTNKTRDASNLPVDVPIRHFTTQNRKRGEGGSRTRTTVMMKGERKGRYVLRGCVYTLTRDRDDRGD